MSLNINYTTEYECMTCNNDVVMTREELRSHLMKIHGFGKSKLRGNKELLMHIARSPRHITTYEIDFNGVKVYERNY